MYAKRHIHDFDGPAKRCRPTNELPGTPEKIEVLARRVSQCQSLFHADDATYEEKPYLAREVVGLRNGLGRFYRLVNELGGVHPARRTSLRRGRRGQRRRA